VIAYGAMLDVSRELVAYVASLLAARRRACGTRRRSRALSCGKQALFALVWFRKREDLTVLAAGFGISRATGYRYRDEAVAVLAARPAAHHRQSQPHRRYRESRPRAHPIRARIPTSVRSSHYGNGVDLDKLAPVAEHRDAEQGAWRVVVAEPGAHYVPGCDEVRLVSARNVDGRPHDVCQHSPCRLQRHLKIVHDLPGLPGNVTERYNPVVLVDRTRTGGVHKPDTGGDYRGVGIRDSTGQAAGADQFHRHEADDATAAARHTTEFTATPADAHAADQPAHLSVATVAAVYADHQAVDPIAKATLILTYLEHRYLPC
jgi:hypothetical protein